MHEAWLAGCQNVGSSASTQNFLICACPPSFYAAVLDRVRQFVPELDAANQTLAAQIQVTTVFA